MRSYRKRYPDEYYSLLPKIYYLSFDGVPFYIGVSKQILIHRLSESVKDCRTDTDRKNQFIKKKLYNECKKLEINLIEITTPDNALFLEEYWIHQFKQWGFTLLNQYKTRPPKRLQTRDAVRYLTAGIKPRLIS